MWRLRWRSPLPGALADAAHSKLTKGILSCQNVVQSNPECRSKVPSLSYSRWHKCRETTHQFVVSGPFLKHDPFITNSVLSNNRICLVKIERNTNLYTTLRNLHSRRSQRVRVVKEVHEELDDEDAFGTLEMKHSLKTRKKVDASSKSIASDVENSPKETVEVDSQQDLSSSDAEKISKLFPRPKEALNNYQTWTQNKVYTLIHKQNTAKHPGKNKLNPKAFSWTTTLKLTWPAKLSFQTNATVKSAASEKAIYKALHWLYTNNKIDKYGKPVHDRETIQELQKDTKKPLTVAFDQKFEEEIKRLMENFENTIQPHLEKSSQKLAYFQKGMPIDLQSSEVTEEDFMTGDATEMNNIYNLNTAQERVDRVYGVAPENKNPAAMEKRSKYLLEMLMNRPEETKMPITDYKDEVVDAVYSNRAIVIQGAPGCGKSTGVPNYILDEWVRRGKGAECGIIVSQPRKVAALSLAHRVASQRGEQVGDAIGHQVRLSTKLTSEPGGGVLYCTAGALLRRLAASPDLPGCSHLILDEAHERSIDSDAVMALAKRCMDLNKKLKVIVMSATIDTELFSRYFKNCPILEVPGFMYPVKSSFLEDFPKDLSRKLPKSWQSSQNHDENFRPYMDPLEVVNVIKWVNKNRPDGAILVFLPGWSEIKKVKEFLENDYERNTYNVYPIHSRLSNEDQHKIFSKSYNGVRKIILATNIAETSITIDDVSYVVDTGLHKEIKLMASKGISSLGTDWVSQANVKQRKGRAGRVKPGECFHMYTNEKLRKFDRNPVPEILRVPLEKTVLDCKTYAEDYNVLDFLQKFPQPPSIQSTEAAIKYLMDLGALDEQENLTPLGRRIASFTTHPKLSKALIHSAIFKVASPVLDLATILTNNTDLFAYNSEQKEEIRDFKRQYHPTSDHQAMFWLNQHYKDMKEKEPDEKIDGFCRSNRIRKERLEGVKYLREIYVAHMHQCKMLSPNGYAPGLGFYDKDTHSSNDELVKGVMYSGLNTLLVLKDTVKTIGKLTKAKILLTDTGQRGFIASDSVNYNVDKKNASTALLYCGAIHSQERRGILVKDTSILSPLSIFIFSSDVKPVHEADGKVLFDIPGKKFKLECSSEQATSLLNLRNIIWSLVKYYIENEGFGEKKERRYSRFDDEVTSDSVHSDQQLIDDYRSEVLEFLGNMLSEAESQILNSTKS